MTKNSLNGPDYANRVIFADDFTGACDAGVQFAKRGISTAVSLGYPTLRDLKITRAALLVYDTETRNVSAERAYLSIRKFSGLCARAKIGLAYKKIDSTLRGNLGSELDGILDVYREAVLIVSPTYPEHRRTVVDGNLLVERVLVENTEFANDPLSPVRSSNLSAVVSSQSSRAVGNIYLRTVRRGSATIVRTINRLSSQGIRIICVDAEDRRDLRNIAIACAQSHALPCGSAGLAEEVAAMQFPPNKLVILSASTNEATMRELRAIARENCVIKARAAELVEEPGRRREIIRLRGLMNDAIQSDERVIAVISALSKADLIQAPSGARRHGSRAQGYVARSLAEAAFPLVYSNAVAAVLVTGGEMAAAFFRKMGARRFELETELLPGVSLGTIISGRAAGLKVVTKAGGFGLSRSMAELIRRLGLAH